MEKEKIIVTKEGFEKLKAELRNLIDVIRPEVIQELKEARAQGDLSENADYDAARARQAEVEARIYQLTEQIDNAEIIDADSKISDVVKVGLFVVLYDSFLQEEVKYQIVGSTESDPENNKISNECLLATSILGHKVGERIVVKAPKQYEVEIRKVSAE